MCAITSACKISQPYIKFCVDFAIVFIFGNAIFQLCKDQFGNHFRLYINKNAVFKPPVSLYLLQIMSKINNLFRLKCQEYKSEIDKLVYIRNNSDHFVEVPFVF